jgi:nucleoside 2-deoxyribosyltransferase
MGAQANSILVQIGQIENTCFIVMPFDSLFQTQYERVIRPAVEELGLKCIRGDEIYSKPQIMADVWKSIRKSRLIIAELTGRNANVFYEIGLAHAIGKPVILLTRNEDDVSFDLKSLRYRYYDVNDPFWGENLHKAIQSMVQNVLEEAELPKYLEGITVELKVPDPPERVDLASQKIVSPIDISGNWKATWKRSTGKIDYEGVIYITQQEEKLSATMTTTYKRAQARTIVQEVLTGTIQGIEVFLNGVSYTYIEQGASNLYHLDNFKLKLDPDRNRMDGEFYSTRGRGQATLIKQESS